MNVLLSDEVEACEHVVESLRAFFSRDFHASQKLPVVVELALELLLDVSPPVTLLIMRLNRRMQSLSLLLVGIDEELHGLHELLAPAVASLSSLIVGSEVICGQESGPDALELHVHRLPLSALADGLGLNLSEGLAAHQVE